MTGVHCSHQLMIQFSMSTLVIAATISILWASTASAIEAPSCTAASQQSTVINFFIHDDLDITPRASAFTVVPSKSTTNGISSSNLFGAIAIFDDSITEGPEVSSTEVARGRGFYVFDYLAVESTSLEFVFTAIFTNQSDYEGSTLTFKGYDNIQDEYREIAITGGTGTFRLARGWAGIYTYAQTGGAAILNTTCYVYYGCNYGISQPNGSPSGRWQTLPMFLIIVLNVAIWSFLLGCHRNIFQ